MVKLLLRFIVCAGMLAMGTGIDSAPVAAGQPARDYPIQPVPWTAVHVDDAFWAPRIETNRTVTIPYLLHMNDTTGRLDNLKRAAGMLPPGPYVGRRFNDTDVYKLLEAIAYSLASHPDPALEKIADDQIAIIAKAQEPDGYLYPARNADPKYNAGGIGPERWSRLHGSHELYDMGHMIEAAVAYYEATHKRNFLDVAVKCADMLCRTFGPTARHDVPGHPEVEIGLVRLYRVTGEKKYFDLAKFFVDQRGHPHDTKNYDPSEAYAVYDDPTRAQDDRPVLEQAEAEGHAVRAVYLYTALTDVAAITGDTAYAKADDRLWENVVGRKMSLTGGLGANHDPETFGAGYVLPNDTPCNETCAAIGEIFWNERMFQLHGDGKHIDLLERAAYNAVLAGVSLSGDRFFYEDPLESNGKNGFNHGSATRAPWFDVSCCPANVARFLASLPGYVYATQGDTLYMNLFVGNEADVDLDGKKVHIKEETNYPWDGDVTLTLEPQEAGEFAVKIRIPSWARDKTVDAAPHEYVPLPEVLYTSYPTASGGAPDPVGITINGQIAKFEISDGYAVLRRAWKKGDAIALHLPLAIRTIQANGQVAANAHKTAFERGPLVYCAEAADNGGQTLKLAIPPDMRFATHFRPDLLGGVSVILMNSQGPMITAIPYYAWSNRGAGEMNVWFNVAGKYAPAP